MKAKKKKKNPQYSFIYLFIYFFFQTQQMNVEELSLLHNCSNNATVRSLVQQCAASDIMITHCGSAIGVVRHTFRGKTWLLRKAVLLGPLLVIYNNFDKKCKGFVITRGASMRKVSENVYWIAGVMCTVPTDKLKGFAIQITSKEFHLKLEQTSVSVDDASKYRKMHSDLVESSHLLLHDKNLKLKAANDEIRNIQNNVDEMRRT